MFYVRKQQIDNVNLQLFIHIYVELNFQIVYDLWEYYLS